MNETFTGAPGMGFAPIGLRRMKQETLLLVGPVPMRRINGARYVESQAVHGLLQWSDNFRMVTAAFVCFPAEVADRLSGIRWECIEDRPDFDRITMVDLPYGYEPLLHFKLSRSVRNTLRPLIAKSHYLCFAIGGCFGDWGSVAGFLAAEQKRPFAIWADRVESQIIRQGAQRKPGWIRKMYGLAYSWLVQVHERRVIKRASLGLFNGGDTFNAYDRFIRSDVARGESSRNGKRAFIVHDLHLGEEDRAPMEAVSKKEADVVSSPSPPLAVGYAGRAADMKAPLDWLKVVNTVRQRGVEIKATWLGDGPLLKSMHDFVKDQGLSACVELPGFVGDHREVVAYLRKWDVLLFTHVTPESPRILLEAMISATPLVGYRSSYARDLVSGFGEDYLVPIGDTEGLAEKLIRLNQDREELRRLVRETYVHSAGFNDVAIFKHRSDLIKELLP